MSGQKGELHVGTSGIVVPGNKTTFPIYFRQKSRLTYYSSLFSSVEINSTFKKLPNLSTLERWVMEVPENFYFTIKLWNEITHSKPLTVDIDKISLFLERIHTLGNKKGCLLIQFPASITNKYFEEVGQILIALQQADTNNEWRKAIEFRHTGWYNNNTLELLNSLQLAIVLHDMPNGENQKNLSATNFVYARFHGKKGDYRGSYDDCFLEEQATKFDRFLRQGKDVYVYFNNTMGEAFKNATQLRELVQKRYNENP